MASRSLRILHLCPFFYPVLGGAEKVTLTLAAGMVARGHQVTVFTSDLGHSGRVSSRSDEIGGVHVHRFPSWFRLGSFASVWPGFCSELRKREFDVIHAHSYRHPHCDLASLRMFRGAAKLVLQPHWPGHPRGIVGNSFAYTYDRTLGRRLLRTCDLVLALTPEESVWLRSLGAKRVEILPNGIPSRFLGARNGGTFRRRHGIDGFFMLSVGRIDEMKGFHFIIRALGSVPGIRYGIAGPPGDYYQPLVKLIQQQGVQDRVILLGQLSEDEVLAALDASDAFIQPSLFEAFGLSALEALARGKACAGSRVGGLSALLSDCGLLFDPGDISGIGRCLERLRDDQGLRNTLGEAGRAKASTLTWEQIIPAYEQKLLELTCS